MIDFNVLIPKFNKLCIDIATIAQRLAPTDTNQQTFKPNPITNFVPGSKNVYPVFAIPNRFNTMWYSLRTGTIMMWWDTPAGIFHGEPNTWPQPDMTLTASLNPVVLPIGTTRYRQVTFAIDPTSQEEPTGSINFSYY